jgi:hypothetical protein
MKRITLKDFLTDREIRRAAQLKDAKKIHDEIIRPSIARINRALGQENDPMYLAYMVEYAVSVAKG